MQGEIMQTYNKLVRDKIPAIIEKNNEKPNTRVLSDEEYIVELKKKLQEETKECVQSESVKELVEELADLEEVLRAILEHNKISYEEFEGIRKAKVEKRGAFKDKIFLESVEENNL